MKNEDWEIQIRSLMDEVKSKSSHDKKALDDIEKILRLQVVLQKRCLRDGYNAGDVIRLFMDCGCEILVIIGDLRHFGYFEKCRKHYFFPEELKVREVI